MERSVVQCSRIQNSSQKEWEPHTDAELSTSNPTRERVHGSDEETPPMFIADDGTCEIILSYLILRLTSIMCGNKQNNNIK